MVTRILRVGTSRNTGRSGYQLAEMVVLKMVAWRRRPRERFGAEKGEWGQRAEVGMKPGNRPSIGSRESSKLMWSLAAAKPKTAVLGNTHFLRQRRGDRD